VEPYAVDLPDGLDVTTYGGTLVGVMRLACPRARASSANWWSTSVANVERRLLGGTNLDDPGISPPPDQSDSEGRQW
jgi:hypothetical protein